MCHDRLNVTHWYRHGTHSFQPRSLSHGLGAQNYQAVKILKFNLSCLVVMINQEIKSKNIGGKGVTDLPRIRGFQHAVLGPAASGRPETGLGIPGVEPRHGRADWHAPGYSGPFSKSEGHPSCQWNVTADGYCQLPLLPACPWFLLRSGAVRAATSWGPGAASPPGKEPGCVCLTPLPPAWLH